MLLDLFGNSIVIGLFNWTQALSCSLLLFGGNFLLHSLLHRNFIHQRKYGARYLVIIAFRTQLVLLLNMLLKLSWNIDYLILCFRWTWLFLFLLLLLFILDCRSFLNRSIGYLRLWLHFWLVYFLDHTFRRFFWSSLLLFCLLLRSRYIFLFWLRFSYLNLRWHGFLLLFGSELFLYFCLFRFWFLWLLLWGSNLLFLVRFRLDRFSFFELRPDNFKLL